ncbi:MAG: hypothetical protein V3U86_01150 [Acidobacteriota bacterium]
MKEKNLSSWMLWIAVVMVLSHPPASASISPHLVWTHSAADLESLARAALPVKFEIGGGWTGMSLVVDDASRFRASEGRLELHLRGHTEPLGVQVETDVSVRLRFDRLKGVHVVELESMPVSFGALGKIDLASTLGPWEIGPEQLHLQPVKGGAGLGIRTTIRALQLSEQGLRAEVEVHYFRPPAE